MAAHGTDTLATLDDAKMRLERLRLETAIESMEGGLFILDRDGSVTVANAAARQVLGALSSGFRNHPDDACAESGRRLPGPCRACLANFFKPARDCVVSVAGRIYDLRVTPLQSSDGEEAARVCVLRDVTEGRRSAIAQAHHERLSVIGELASVIAHELNNPLAAISMFSQMLVEQLHAGSQAHGYAEVIRRNTLACRHTIVALLEIASNAPTERVDLDLDALVEEVIELLRPLASRARVELRTLRRAADESVRADGHQIRQALVNLVMNAIHAAGEAGRGAVGIGTEVRGGDLVIRVEDNGRGVPEELAERVFEPFFTTRPPGEGTGLGLPISRRIVEAHGGRLVLCPGDGRGAVFEICLPRIETGSDSAEATLGLAS